MTYAPSYHNANMIRLRALPGLTSEPLGDPFSKRSRSPKRKDQSKPDPGEQSRDPQSSTGR
eukprot:2392450-Amphidinium_carterae.1